MSGQRTEPFGTRNPSAFGALEAAAVQRGLGERMKNSLRPFSATGARSIELAADKVADPDHKYQPAGVVKHQQQLQLSRRPSELLPWDSDPTRTNKNPFQRSGRVTCHMPHIAKGRTVRQVPLAHLRLAMEIDDTVGLATHHGTLARRNEERAASLGQVLMKNLAQMNPDDDDEEAEEEANRRAAASSERRELRRERKRQRQEEKKMLKKNEMQQEQEQAAAAAAVESGAPLVVDSSNVSSGSVSPSRSPSQSQYRPPSADSEAEIDERRLLQRGGFSSGVVTQSHVSLSIVTKRTRSMYLQRLASKLEEMSSDDAADGDGDGAEHAEDQEDDEEPRPLQAHQQPQHQQQQQQQRSLSHVFAQMEQLKQQWVEQHGGIEMPPRMARRKLLELFERDQAAAAAAATSSSSSVITKQQAATDAAAMDDIAPPSAGFESNHEQRSRIPSAACSRRPQHQQQQQQQQSRTASAASSSSSRGFFLNGKQRHELVSQVVARAQQRQMQQQQQQQQHDVDENADQHISSPKQQQKENVVVRTGEGVSDVFAHNRFKYNHEQEYQRLVHRSWGVRDRLNLRHSTRSVAIPKARRTITVTANPDPQHPGMRDIVTGNSLSYVQH